MNSRENHRDEKNLIRDQRTRFMSLSLQKREQNQFKLESFNANERLFSTAAAEQVRKYGLVLMNNEYLINVRGLVR